MAELVLILIGITVGGYFAALGGQAVPGITGEARFGISVVGSVLGAVVAYLLLWAAKREQLQAAAKSDMPVAPQVVGSPCETCGTRMIMMAEGHVCPRCQRVYCIRCEPQLPCKHCEILASSRPPIDSNSH